MLLKGEKIHHNNMNNTEYTEIGKGVRLHYFKEEQFSTNFISVIWTVPADRNSATKVALISECLKLGKGGDRASLDRQLSNMYGANLDSVILQKGGRQLISINMECITDKAAGEKLFKNAAELVKTVVHEKICDKALIEAKARLKTYIEQKRDSTAQTAMERLIDIVYTDDAFSVHCDGYIEDIEGISLNEINELYCDIKAGAPTDIFISGDMDEETALKAAKNFVIRRDISTPLPEDKIVITSGCAEKSEGRAVGQSRVAVAYEMGLKPWGKDFAVAMVLREILCGSGCSILYDNVRQKEGLCYYIGGRIMRFRMLLAIDAGVEKGSEEKTASLIDECIKTSDITDFQLQRAKKAVLRDECISEDGRTGKINKTMNDILLGITRQYSTENDIISVSLKDVKDALSHLVRKGVFILYAQKEEK